ncbi:hypothetical protein QBC47DRAFT_403108 [Echria macrotheca]|uniref:Uncharacterized protein n=1 Tax=Echria macrotheca TaxID=438768 RepID=A0AAJ0BAY4_9PEZI|nr:hypothetical protein QBC47DRAFT_403108 [Echria macrotheca]
MKGAVLLAAAALGVANAKLTKWSRDRLERDWLPAQETLGVMPALQFDPATAAAPMPTSAPKWPSPRAPGLQKRASTDNTCAYVGGSSEVSLYCDATAYCASDSSSHIGCCDDVSSRNCKVWTTCYDMTESAKYTTNNGLSLWCGISSYPHCITHIYADSTGAASIISGYTLFGCAVAGGTDRVFFNAFTAESSSSARRSSSSSDAGTTTPASSSAKTTTTFTSTPTPAPAPSSTNVGAIAGGVVGGVAALGLIILGIWYLIRQNKKDKNDPSASPSAAANVGPAGGYGGPGGPGAPPPQMMQNTPPPAQGYYGGASPPTMAGFAPVDPRNSMAKPQHTSTIYESSNFSPPDSPPPPQSPPFQGGQSTPSPPPPQSGYGNQGPAGYGGGGGGYGQTPPQTTSPSSYGGQQPGYGGYQGQEAAVGGYQQSGYQQQGGGYQQGGYQPQGPYSQGLPPAGPQQVQQQYTPYRQPGQGYAELSTHRGDGEVRELQG